MRIESMQAGRLTMTGAVLALLASVMGSGAATAQEAGEPVAVCELAYYTGEFAPFGESLSNDVIFAVNEVVNTDPPLGRPWELFHEDLGTVGEAQAARTCLEQHGAEIVVSIAHGYRTYRDFMMDWWQENDSPLGPSVHGGAIPGNLGGKAAEPIFRAQGLDEALGTSGSLYADSIGAENVVILATQVEGFQLAADAAEKAAEALGLEVLARIDVPAEQPSYRAEAERIAGLAPGAVIVQAGSVESATLIRQAAEAGVSTNWIGETGWVLPEFIDTLGAEAVAGQQGVGFAAFSPNKDTSAWETFSNLWNERVDTETFGGPEDQYHWSTYDLLVQTALAVEAAGSYSASAWAPAMFAVGDPPGEVCNDYATCLALIRDGQDIDYEGMGPGTYTTGGVNAVNPSYTPYGEDGTIGEATLLDAQQWLEMVDQIKVEATCDPADPPNQCEW
jgi:branched-chain amino acid transport system substrate-binding protein